MNSALRLAALMCLVTTVAAPGNAQTNVDELPELADYAWGFPIQLDGDASFHSVILPLAVNQSLSDPQLRDAGVYNSQGQPVPRVFAPARDGFEENELRRRLPILPLYTKELNEDDAVDLLLKRDGDETTLQFHLGGSTTQALVKGLSAYIVDARDLDVGIDALDFEWLVSESGFIGQIHVDTSDDLRTWRTAGSAAIADLREDASVIVQRRVKLDRPKQDFLRVRWEDTPDDWQLSGVDAVYKTSTTRVIRESLRLDPSSTDPEDGGRIFDIGGAALIDRIQVLLSEPNVVVTAVIFYWAEPAARWTRIIDGSFHHVGHDNKAVVSEPLSIGPLRTSRLKVVILRGQKDAPLQLEVGWRPDTLLFLAQGTAPYTLAVGRAEDSKQGFPQQRVYGVDAISELAAKNGASVAATLGPRFSLGGESQLTIVTPGNWSQIALWMGLAFGVLFVSYMTYRIIRDQKIQ